MLYPLNITLGGIFMQLNLLQILKLGGSEIEESEMIELTI